MNFEENLNVLTEDFNNLYRLPDTVLPIRYKLTLDPDLEKGTFRGNILIDVEVMTSSQRIFLNCHELKVAYVRVTDKAPDESEDLSHNSTYLVHSVSVQKQRQLLIIHMQIALNPGQYTIAMAFNGSLNSESLGLYRTWTSNAEDSSRYCMATYFEPTYARFAYPCFDEPHFKAKYLVSLVKPSSDHYIALSNSSVKLEVVDYPRVGATTVHFNETPPISSYLTCFVVGVFECLDSSLALSGQVPVSVYSRASLVGHTATARDLASKILDFFSQYFQIDYPFPKLDLIAIPDSKLSGMENWGLITFRESALLLDDAEASTAEFLTVARVVIHELSHMWFGNLVTIAWWNDTWLKEGMADFMSYIGGNHAYPSWYKEWVFLNGQVFPALDRDSAVSSRPVVQAVSHPDQIREMFDVISYLKGSCLIRMLHDLDTIKFQHGLNIYVHKMKWTDAQTTDLWQCLSESMGWNVGDVMGPWTEQAGYPVVTITRQGQDFVLSQTRFLTGSSTPQDPIASPYNYLWDIPIKYIARESSKKVDFVWFHRHSDSVTISCSHSESWIKLNWHNVGFYRVNYPLSMWNKFGQLLQQDISVFDAEDRCNLMNDAWCLAKEGYVKYEVPLSLMRYLSQGKEDNFLVWSVVRTHLEMLQALLSSSNSSQLFHKYVEKILNPVIFNINWNTGKSVPYMERKLRVELMELACLLGFNTVLERIRSMFSDWMENKKSKGCPEVRTVVHTYGLTGNENKELWEKTWQQYIAEKNPAQILNYLRSVASTCDPDLITRLLVEVKNPDVVRSQDFFILLRFLSKSAVGNRMVWSFIRSEWEYMVERFSINDLHLGRIVSLVVSHFSTPQQLAQVEEFFGKYPEAGAGASERKYALETIRANIRWKNDNNKYLDKWFSKVQP